MVCKNCTKIIFDFRYLIKTFYETEEFLKTSLSKKELVSKTSDSEDQQQFKNDNNEEIFYNDDGKIILKNIWLKQVSEYVLLGDHSWNHFFVKHQFEQRYHKKFFIY